MKFVFTICTGMLFTVAFAQQTEKKGSVFQHIGIQDATIDSSITPLKSDTGRVIIMESSKTRKSKNMEIPTRRDDISKGYTTPVRKLSGKGLAPMPGTDSLGKHDTIPHKVPRPKVIIRRTPQKK